MKYVVILCDGMADLPRASLGNKTPMEVAYKPAMNALAALSEVGLATTVPADLPAGSDVANLSVLGYDPHSCYTGRSPLEAASIGVKLADDDMALRCNLVTLSDEPVFGDKRMLDYCGGNVSTAEADELIHALQQAFGGGEFDFYTGTEYRHCLVWHGCKRDFTALTPPHDISDRVIGPYLSTESTVAPLLRIMEQSVSVLKDHPVNRKRAEKGLPPANAAWLWGHGRRPQLPTFKELFGLNGAMVSAVDLLKGIATLAGMQVCHVEGATGYINTNFVGKRQAALDALRSGCDFAYVHLEAPDECGHRGEEKNKIAAIESIDREILAPMLPELREMGDFTLLICPDHPTPLSLRTHTHDAIPYLLYRSNAPLSNGPAVFSEASAAATGITVAHGYELLPRMLGK